MWYQIHYHHIIHPYPNPYPKSLSGNANRSPTHPIPKTNLMLTTTSNKQPLIIPSRLPLDPMRQTRLKAVMIRALNLLQMIPVPVDSHYSVCEQVVFCACAAHGVFEEEGVAHGFVGAGAELVEEG